MAIWAWQVDLGNGRRIWSHVTLFDFLSDFLCLGLAKIVWFFFFWIYTGFSRIWIDQGESRTMMASDLRSCEYHPDLIHRFQLHLRRSGSWSRNFLIQPFSSQQLLDYHFIRNMSMLFHLCFVCQLALPHLLTLPNCHRIIICRFTSTWRVSTSRPLNVPVSLEDGERDEQFGWSFGMPGQYEQTMSNHLSSRNWSLVLLPHVLFTGQWILALV